MTEDNHNKKYIENGAGGVAQALRVPA
jgi:hypothetical protein